MNKITIVKTIAGFLLVMVLTVALMAVSVGDIEAGKKGKGGKGGKHGETGGPNLFWD